MSGPSGSGAAEVLHASAVAVGTRGLLILGPSGSGKSTLALQLIALGAQLVADDRVIATPTPESGVLLSAPETIRGRIEARGVGLLCLEAVKARAFAVVDLSRTEERRLPEPRETVISGERLPLLSKVESPAFASILRVYLTTGHLEQ